MSVELCRASARGEKHKVLALLKKGAEVVNWACFDVVEALLSVGADFNIRDPVLGLTPLHDAARAGYIGSVEKLVQCGSDVNLCEERGNLPLHLAAMEGKLEVIRLLIGLTADPRARNAEGYNAGELAHKQNHMEAAKYIEDYLSSN
ncbi:hypothetical protein JOQ06_005523 [Pogonophryne albipinna]|uniref:Uncharacterized protein n=1 Tax=Pogonophryne albipinna TaxID=1090488 RepID=A0AAD6FRR6_9TELE|nr:hypothetical protein JOQ06_005523 [Pogonophryne albipinna]